MSKPNRQHLPRAASFKRIAKAVRRRAATELSHPQIKRALRILAQELDAEAKLLRSMR